MAAIQLRDVDQLVLKRLRRNLAKDYAPNTVKLTMAYAGMILRAAHTSGRIARDPTAGLREKERRAGEEDDRVRPEDVPTRAEALAILNGTPGSFRAAVALGLAGLRVGEVLGLTADRVAIDARQVTVDRQMQRYSGRGGADHAEGGEGPHDHRPVARRRRASAAHAGPRVGRRALPGRARRRAAPA